MKKKSKKKAKKVKVAGQCFQCRGDVGEDAYCFGCANYICEECNTNPETSGYGHNRLQHTMSEESD